MVVAYNFGGKFRLGEQKRAGQKARGKAQHAGRCHDSLLNLLYVLSRWRRRLETQHGSSAEKHSRSCLSKTAGIMRSVSRAKCFRVARILPGDIAPAPCYSAAGLPDATS